MKTFRTRRRATPRLRREPRSRIRRNATTNIDQEHADAQQERHAEFVACAITPPATEPPNIAAPPTIWPRPNTDSRPPSYRRASSASTSHASTAPEKKVKPSPSSTERTAHAQNGATLPSRYRGRSRRERDRAQEIRDSPAPGVGDDAGRHLEDDHARGEERVRGERLRVARPASSRKSVLMPQMNDAASVFRAGESGTCAGCGGSDDSYLEEATPGIVQ